MSRLDELKKQYKDSSLSKLDAFKMIVPDQANKYAELLARIYKAKVNVLNELNDSREKYLYEVLEYVFNNDVNLVDENHLKSLPNNELREIVNAGHDFGTEDLRLVLKFCNLNERNLIDNSDITSYKSLGQIREAVAIAELKLLDKEAAKSVYKVFEDDEWILVRPLTIEASSKYGASTKWCTVMIGKDYFHRYSRRGTLIYSINKKTGYKVACFKNHNPDHDNEFSFWNDADIRIDSIDSDLPGYVMEVIRQEVKKEICNDQLEGYVDPHKSERVKNEHLVREIMDEVIAAELPEAPVPEEWPPTTPPINEAAISTSGGMIFSEQPDAVLNISQSRIEQTRDNLLREIDQLVERAAEVAVEIRAQQQPLLEGIELGTLSDDYKRRMQLLAGINPVTQDIISERAKLDDVPSEQQINWFNKLKNKLKNSYERITKKDIQSPNVESHSSSIGGDSGN